MKEEHKPHSSIMAAGRTDLSEVSVDDLLAEVQRRLACQSKPEKRVILIGAVSAPLLSVEISIIG